MHHDSQLFSASRLKLPSSSASASTYGLGVREVVSRLLGVEETRVGTAPAEPPSIEEQAFNAVAAAKVWTSQVAMHMDLTTRDRFFRQLDLLHDCEEWPEEEPPVLLASYQGFIRFMLRLGGHSKPSLGLGPDGRLSAIWQAGSNRLTIEFVDRDNARWVVNRQSGQAVERAAGSTALDRLIANLAPYHPEEWFEVE